MRLGQLKLKNRLLFKEATFNFAHTGLTVVLGLNLNANRSTNGAGKSYLFSVVRDLIYKDVIIGSRRDRDMTGEVSLEFLSPKNKSVLTFQSKQAGAKGHKLTLLKDGVDLEIREKEQVYARVHKVAPASIEAYSTLCSIDVRIPHPLIMGDTAARKRFFTEFFELDSTDNLQKLFKSEIDDIKASVKLLGDKQTRLANIEVKDVSALTEVYEKLDRRTKALKEKHDAWRSEQEIASFIRKHESKILQTLSLGKPLTNQLKKVEDKIKAMQRLEDQQDAYAEHRALTKAYKTAVAEHKYYVAEHLEGCTTDLITLRAGVQAARKVVAKAQFDLEDHRESRDRIKHKLAHTDSDCKTCGQPVTMDKAKVRELKENLIEVTSLGKAAKVAVARGQDRLDELESVLVRLEAAPFVPKAPREPEGKPEEEFDKEALAALRDKAAKLAWQSDDLFSQVLSLSKEQVLELAKREDPTDSYLAIYEKTKEAQQALAEAEADAEVAASLEADIAELRTRAEDAEAFKILEKAYGPAGIRIVVINSICQRLQDQLNRYGKSLFPEDFSFQLDMETQFDIVVNRKANGKVSTSDVRKLSGAESAMFAILLWASLLSFVPVDKRPNYIILDELDANLGQAQQERLLAFLPKMLSVVPHVIFITPKSETRFEDYVPGVQYKTIVKKNEYAKIKDGKHI